jgi:hypothetical protein
MTPASEDEVAFTKIMNFIDVPFDMGELSLRVNAFYEFVKRMRSSVFVPQHQ